MPQWDQFATIWFTDLKAESDWGLASCDFEKSPFEIFLVIFKHPYGAEILVASGKIDLEWNKSRNESAEFDAILQKWLT